MVVEIEHVLRTVRCTVLCLSKSNVFMLKVAGSIW